MGVSLCDAEASIAAPMTSRTPHIGVMVTVVAEGRGSMTTTLIIFKYIMVYAFTQVSAHKAPAFLIARSPHSTRFPRPPHALKRLGKHSHPHWNSSLRAHCGRVLLVVAQVLSLALLYNEGLTVGNYQVRDSSGVATVPTDPYSRASRRRLAHRPAVSASAPPPPLPFAPLTFLPRAVPDPGPVPHERAGQLHGADGAGRLAQPRAAAGARAVGRRHPPGACPGARERAHKGRSTSVLTCAGWRQQREWPWICCPA